MANCKKLNGYVYCIENTVNGKRYIGRTNNFKRRYFEHFGKRDTCTILQKAFVKYGKENFKMFPLVTFSTFNPEVLDETLNTLEKYYIDKYNTYKRGYNATLGGDGNCGWNPSVETLQRRSKALKGRKVSDEERERLRQMAKNRVWTKEQREHHSVVMKNRPAEVVEKIASKHRGRKRNITWAYKWRKPILQYSTEGIFIKEHECAQNIPGVCHTNVIACCKGRINSAYGYIWRYKTGENYPLVLTGIKKVRIQGKKIIQLDKEGNVIQEFNSRQDVINKTGLKMSALSNCLAKLSKTCGGYVWKYKEEVTHELQHHQ